MAQIWSLLTLLFLNRFQQNFARLSIPFTKLFAENFTKIVLVVAKIQRFKLGHCFWYISTMKSINDVTTLCITHCYTAGSKLFFFYCVALKRAVLVSVWHDYFIWCSKWQPFTRTQACKRRRHSSTARSTIAWSNWLHSSIRRCFRWSTSRILVRYTRSCSKPQIL